MKRWQKVHDKMSDRWQDYSIWQDYREQMTKCQGDDRWQYNQWQDDRQQMTRWQTLDDKMKTDWKGRVSTRWQQDDRLSKMKSSRLTLDDRLTVTCK